jgi:hypothetical protein
MKKQILLFSTLFLTIPSLISMEEIKTVSTKQSNQENNTKIHPIFDQIEIFRKNNNDLSFCILFCSKDENMQEYYKNAENALNTIQFFIEKEPEITINARDKNGEKSLYLLSYVQYEGEIRSHFTFCKKISSIIELIKQKKIEIEEIKK